MIKQSSNDAREEAELRQKIAGGSQDPADYRNLAGLVFTAGHYKEAVSLYQQLLHLPLTNYQKAKASTELGWIFYETCQQTEATRLVENALGLLSRELESPEVLHLRGSAQSLLAHCLSLTDEKSGAEAADLALHCFQRVMVDAPNFEAITQVYYEAARLQNMLGNGDEAITLCEKCLQQELDEEDQHSFLIILAEAFRLQERFADAEEKVKQAFRYVKGDDRQIPVLYFTLGLIQRSTNHPTEALESFHNVLKAWHRNSDLTYHQNFFTQVYQNMGELYYELGDFGKALKTLEEIINRQPEDDVDHRNALLWMGYCFEETEAFTKAQDCFEKVLASPQTSEDEMVLARQEIAKSRAKLYYQAERYSEAAAAFEEALAYYSKDDPYRPSVLHWLGHSYFGAEDHAKARQCYEELLSAPHASEEQKASAQKNLSRLPHGPKKVLH